MPYVSQPNPMRWLVLMWLGTYIVREGDMEPVNEGPAIVDCRIDQFEAELEPHSGTTYGQVNEPWNREGDRGPPD